MAVVALGRRALDGWQFMQRGLSITLPASVNRATERAAGSLIETKSAGLLSVSAGAGATGAGAAAQTDGIRPTTVATQPAVSRTVTTLIC
jgi:hypothetical protein